MRVTTLDTALFEAWAQAVEGQGAVMVDWDSPNIFTRLEGVETVLRALHENGELSTGSYSIYTKMVSSSVTKELEWLARPDVSHERRRIMKRLGK